MAGTLNGIGTDFVGASAETGSCHDAVECFVVLFLPVFPIRAVHILHTTVGDEASFVLVSERQAKHRTVPLRLTPRMCIKAFAARWGIMTGAFAGGLTLMTFALWIIGPFVLENPDHQSSKELMSDMLNLALILLPFALAGWAMRIAYWMLDASDNQVKDVIGSSQLGHSDPYYWSDDIAASVLERMNVRSDTQSLLDAAESSNLSGDRSLAVILIRLAMRRSQDRVVLKLFDLWVRRSEVKPRWEWW